MAPQDADDPPRRERAKRRKTISKTVRFEVFKRDQFTCQYCGRKAPEVVLEPRPVGSDAGDTGGLRLHVDHIDPLALGGADDVLNYVTACADCNLGKGARPLADDSVMAKRRTQLDELAARREQIEMLYAWQHALGDLETATRERLADYWHGLAPGFTLNATGKKRLARLHASFSVEEIMAAMRVAATTYLAHDEAGAVTQASWEEAFLKIGGICKVTRDEATEPEIKRLYYIRAILRNRFPGDVNEGAAIRLLRRGAQLGWDLDWMQDLAKDTRSYYRWRRDMEDLIAEDEAADARRDAPAPAPAPPTPVQRTAAAPGRTHATSAAAPPPLSLTAVQAGPTRAALTAQLAAPGGYAEVPLESSVLRGFAIEAFAPNAAVEVFLPPVEICGVRATTVARIERADDAAMLAGAETLPPAPPGAGAAISVRMDWVPARESAAQLAAARIAWAVQASNAWPSDGAPPLYAVAAPHEVFWALGSDEGMSVVEGGYTVWVSGRDLAADLGQALALHATIVEWATHRFPLPALPGVPSVCSDRVQPIAPDAIDRIDLTLADTLPPGLRIAVGTGERPAADRGPALDLVTTGRPDLPLVGVLEDVLRPIRGPGVARWLADVAALRANRESLAGAGIADLIALPPEQRTNETVFRLLVIPAASDDRLERVLASFSGAWEVGRNIAMRLAVGDDVHTELGRALLRQAFAAEVDDIDLDAGLLPTPDGSDTGTAPEEAPAAPATTEAPPETAIPPAPAAPLTARDATHPDERRAPARAVARPGRNDPCSCGSGKKFKRCCL